MSDQFAYIEIPCEEARRGDEAFAPPEGDMPGLWFSLAGPGQIAGVHHRRLKCRRRVPAVGTPWIPLTERLPDPRRVVLILDSASWPAIAYLVDDGGLFYDPDFGYRQATHWCPITGLDDAPFALPEDQA